MTQAQGQDPHVLTKEAQGKAQAYKHAQEKEHLLSLVLRLNDNRSSVMAGGPLLIPFMAHYTVK